MATVERVDIDVPVEALRVHACTVPTEEPESDGTLEWDATTIVIVEARAGGRTGIGYTYSDASAARLVESTLAPVVEGASAMDVRATWLRIGARARNIGRPGLAFCAISAVDQALWDLKARLLEVPLTVLLGAAHDSVPVYGSGGFCSYALERLHAQLEGWASAGIPRVKIKVGREPELDPARLDAAREAIGADVELFVDANGAYARKGALAWAERYASEWGVTWFEEPVSSADAEGLRLLRDRSPGGLEIAAGEYGYVPADFRNLIDCVDCLQVDVTRCGGITGLLSVSGLADAHAIDLSGQLCTRDLGPGVRRRQPAAPPRVLPRPRSRRGDALRRHPRAGGRTPAPRPLAPRQRPGAEGAGGRAMGGVIQRTVENLREGRMQKLLAAATAFSALPLGVEIYLEHYRGSFGDKWMWTPIVLTPPLTVAGIAGVFSEKAARRWLPFFGALYALDGVIGIVTHVRGVQRKPGGFAELTYNLVMGPPLLAPGSLAMVGGFGVVAGLVRRER